MPNTAYPLAGRWTDSNSPALAQRSGGTAPTFMAWMGGIFGVRFATNDEMHGAIQLPHLAISGGELRMHVHFKFAAGATTVAAETVIWSIEYNIAAPYGRYAAANTIVPATYILDGTEGGAQPMHLLLHLTTITLPTPAESCDLSFRVFKSGGTTTVAPYLMHVDGHFQQGQMGTADELPA